MEEKLKHYVEIINKASTKTQIEEKSEEIKLPNTQATLSNNIKLVIFSNFTENELLCKIS
jgi:hypothetical protein